MAARPWYSILEEFYEALESSIALLRVRSQASTFAAVSQSVESLTKRRFLRSHLARIKYIFPEAFECDSFTWKDLDTLSMKSDLRIKLLPFSSSDKGAKTVSGMTRKFSADTMARRREFHRRVTDLAKTCAKETDVPEAALLGQIPEIHKTAEEIPREIPQKIPVHESPCASGKFTIKSGYQDIVSRRLALDDEVTMSHFPAQFRPYFSKPRGITATVDAGDVVAAAASPAPGDVVAAAAPPASGDVAVVAAAEDDGDVANVGDVHLVVEANTPCGPVTPGNPSTPLIKKNDNNVCTPKRQSVVKSLQFDSNSAKTDIAAPATPAASTAAVATPAASPAVASTSPVKRTMSSFGSPSKRSMVKSPGLLLAPSTPVNAASLLNDSDGICEADKEIINCLSPHLVQSVREKQKKIMEDEKNNVAEMKRRQHMIAGLPNLLNMTRLIFQSHKCSVMLHHELHRKLISSSLDITDKDEIEERVKLLVEIAPDWITFQPSLSGDFMYRVHKGADFAGIRKRILKEYS